MAVKFPTITTLNSYEVLLTELQKEQAGNQRQILRHYLRTDLFFLIWFGLNREDMWNQWLFDRCREVQAVPNGMLDLWAREHYKSTIITFGLTIQDVLSSHGQDPLPKWKGKEQTIGIFSHTRPTAKAFLRQIKQECEGNELLKENFDDVLWINPKKSAPKWSEDDGLIFQRESNPKESTIEAHGVVDGQPTGRHFDILLYDDVVTEKSVTTEEMRAKTTDQLALSYNLGANGGIRRFVGTRYHFNDTYKEVIARKTVRPRIHAATDDGTIDGQAVFLDQKTLMKKRKDQGSYIFGCQMLQNPKSEDTQGFKAEWLRYWEVDPSKGTNRYILVDPAGSKNKGSDYTSMWVVAAGADRNFYVLEVFRDKLNLTERGKKLFQLHKRWSPMAVAYEKYGLQSDIEHFEDKMEQVNYRFEITEVGGQIPKNDRIRRLVPLFEQKRIYLPRAFSYKNYQGVVQDQIQIFRNEEYIPFPVGFHPDMLDSLSRIVDIHVEFPKEKKTLSSSQLAGNSGHIV